jgi:hypothetical protein
MGASAVTGSSNTSIGSGSGVSLLAGANNVFIGTDAGGNTTGGSSNICIGMNARAAAGGTSNELSIGGSVNYVATNGNATTYFPAGAVIAPATVLGFIRIRLNGTQVQLAVYPV